jgi:hypothetical protein
MRKCVWALPTLVMSVEGAAAMPPSQGQTSGEILDGGRVWDSRTPVYNPNLYSTSHFVWIKFRLKPDKACAEGRDFLQAFWGFGNYGSNARRNPTVGYLGMAAHHLSIPLKDGSNAITFSKKEELREFRIAAKWGQIANTSPLSIKFGSKLKHIELLKVLGISGNNVSNKTLSGVIVPPKALFCKGFYGLEGLPHLFVQRDGYSLWAFKGVASLRPDVFDNPTFEFIFDRNGLCGSVFGDDHIGFIAAHEMGASNQDVLRREDFTNAAHAGYRPSSLNRINEIVGGHNRPFIEGGHYERCSFVVQETLPPHKSAWKSQGHRARNTRS